MDARLEAKDKDIKSSRPRARMLKARTQRASVLRKKKVFVNLPRGLRRSPRRKNGHDLGLFLTNQKIVLSSTKEKAFSKNSRLCSQDQEPQIVFSRTSSRLRTSLRTPPLVFILVTSIWRYHKKVVSLAPRFLNMALMSN